MLLVRRVSNPAGGSPRLASTRIPPYFSPSSSGVGVSRAGLGVATDVGAPCGSEVAVGTGLGVTATAVFGSTRGDDSPVQESAILTITTSDRSSASRKDIFSLQVVSGQPAYACCHSRDAKSNHMIWQKSAEIPPPGQVESVLGPSRVALSTPPLEIRAASSCTQPRGILDVRFTLLSGHFDCAPP